MGFEGGIDLGLFSNGTLENVVHLGVTIVRILLCLFNAYVMTHVTLQVLGAKWVRWRTWWTWA